MDANRPETTPRTGSRGLSRWIYYLSSIPTILLRMKNPLRIVALFLGLPVRRPLEVELRGGARFLVRTRMEVWILKESCLDRDSESGAVAVRDGWTVLDIGAGLGDFAVRVARDCPGAAVYAFEPFPESFALLQKNMELNRVTNVQAFPEAVAGHAGTLDLYTVTGLSGQHRTAGDGAKSIAVPVRVPAVTLAAALERIPSKRCDFLKIDCEGAEYGILFAADEATLSRIGHIAMEYHDAVTRHTHEEMARFLEARGFQVRTRPSPAWRELGFLYASRRAPAGTPAV
ncbi:MAG TPA: FkbM family methyltransferase [Thermoanaerobaculia bacterium]